MKELGKKLRILAKVGCKYGAYIPTRICCAYITHLYTSTVYRVYTVYRPNRVCCVYKKHSFNMYYI
jgi:hypothetical protein